MFRKLAVTTFVLLLIAFAAATLIATPAAPRTCPKGSHLVSCPDHSFCCPNNAFCVCWP